MKKTLFYFVHPVPRKSRTNRRVLEEIKLLPEVTVRDLYETYPHFHIDVDFEKNLLLAHDLIVFQHPMYWYSCPPLMKLWIDEVLERGFAYGEGGEALKGKFWMQIISTGGPETAYQRSGYNRFTISELLRPFEQTAELCQMHYLKPFLIQGVRQLSDLSIQDAAEGARHYLQDAINGKVEKFSSI
ncbi:MAG: NAD(P)H-dependent oxidoreductase [Oligoflexia bacterium]|nr:NAD(P)H-dependent oxidoreductase [Oligoflexia bacterium]